MSEQQIEITRTSPRESSLASFPDSGQPAPSGPGRARRGLKLVGGERIGFGVLWIAIIVSFSLALPGTYFTIDNLSTVLSSQANLLILTLAAILPLTSGDFDLSIAGVSGLSATLIGVLNVQHHVPVGWAVLVALAAGVAIGAVNCVIVVVVGADCIVATLGMATLLGGVVLWMSNSASIAGISDSLVRPVIIDRFLHVPLAFYYALALCLALWWVQSYTALGQRLLFIGQSRDVARLSAVRVDLIRSGSLITGSLIAAFSGVISVGVSGAADPSNAPGLLLPAFAAAFLGAAALGRGRFSAWSCLLAVYFLVSGITGLQQLGAQSYVQDLFYGTALAVAVTFARISARYRDRNQAARAEVSE